MFTLRPAQAPDFPAIQSIIRNAHINPMGLKWDRFLVAVDQENRVIGCGQIKPHSDGSFELASIAVKPDWRGQGAARAIIERLISSHRGDLYLTCRASLGALYEKFGFSRITDPEAMPGYFRRVSRLFKVFKVFTNSQEDLWVMKRPGENRIREKTNPSK
ncbi:MAG: GNAT family N-acetyltransferase [Anaerolineales bacterium]